MKDAKTEAREILTVIRSGYDFHTPDDRLIEILSRRVLSIQANAIESSLGDDSPSDRLPHLPKKT